MKSDDEQQIAEFLHHVGTGALDAVHHAEPAGWAETAVEVTNNPRCAEVAAFLRGLQE